VTRFITPWKTDEHLEVWNAIAIARGGGPLRPENGIGDELGGIEIDVGETFIVADVCPDNVGQMWNAMTRIRAPWPLTAGPVFHVFKDNVLSKIGRALGAQDVVLGGDTTFDEAFVVKCNDPEATRMAWTPLCKKLMRAELADCEVSSDGIMVELQCVGVWTERGKLEAGLDLVSGLAGNERVLGLDSLKTLPGVSYEPSRGPLVLRNPPRATLEVRGVSILAAPVVAEGRAYTRLWTLHGSSVRPFPPLQLSGDAALPWNVGDSLGAVGRDLAGSSVSCNEVQLRVDFAGIERRTHRLLKGAELLASIVSGGHQSAYR